MSDEIIESLEEQEYSRLLKGGFSVFGDVVIYYHEGLGRDISGGDLMVLRAITGNEWQKFKQGLRAVPKRTQEFPEPDTFIDYGGWDDAYRTMFDRAKIEYRSRDKAAFDFTVQKMTVDEVVTLENSEYLARYDPTIRPKALKLAIPRVDDEGKIYAVDVVESFPYYVPNRLTKPPFYKPSYRSCKPDLPLLNRFAKLCAQVPLESAKEFFAVYNRLIESTYTHVLSSGNMIGQVGRIKKAFTIRNEMLLATDKKTDNLLAWASRPYTELEVPVVSHRRNKLFRPNIPFEVYQAIMNKRAPFAKKPVTAKLFINDVFALGVTWQQANGVSFKFFKVNRTASAGLWLSDDDKGKTILTDSMATTWLLNRLQQLVTNGELDREKYLMFLDAFFALFMPETKNKMEIGERDKLKNKKIWRNYYVFNSFVQLPAAILFENIYKNVDPSADPLFKSTVNPEIWSLLGWSAYHGGLQDLLVCMAQEAKEKGYSIAVYSDNVYVLQYDKGEFYWYSLDASSMEACITKADAFYFMRHVCDEYWEGEMTQGYSVYANQFYVDICIDGTALLGNLQWTNVGMFSGQGGTAYINNAKSTTRCTVLDRLLKDWKGGSYLREGSILPEPNSSIQYGERILNPELDKAFSLGGMYMKVERVTRSDVFKFVLGEPVELKAGTIELDLLGFDMVYAPEIGTHGGLYPCFPVLADDKLYNGLAYNKLNVESKKMTDEEKRLLNNLRLKAYYVLGAWRYKPLAALIHDRISSHEDLTEAKKRLEAGESLHSDIVEEAILEIASRLDSAAAEAIGVTLSGLTLPTVYDVLQIYHTKVYADQFLISAVYREGPIAALAYANVKEVVTCIQRQLQEDPECLSKLLEGKTELLVEFLETAESRAFGDPEDFKARIQNIRETLNLTRKDVQGLAPIFEYRRTEEISAKSRVEIPNPTNPRPKRTRVDLSKMEPVNKVMLEVKLESYTSKQKKASVPKPLTPESKKIIDRILAYVKDEGVVLGELFDYAGLMKQAGITKAQREGIKERGESRDFFLHLDVDLERFTNKALARMVESSTAKGKQPQVSKTTVLKRIQRADFKEEEKIRRKDEKTKEAKARKQGVEKQIKEEKLSKKKEKQQAKEDRSEAIRRKGTASFTLTARQLTRMVQSAGQGEMDLALFDTALKQLTEEDLTKIHKRMDLDYNYLVRSLKHPDSDADLTVATLALYLLQGAVNNQKYLRDNIGLLRGACYRLQSIIKGPANLDSIAVPERP